jgi:hexosaminidase
VYPRIAALAELGWSRAEGHDWNDFLGRLPAELARYHSLGIGYADSAFAPAFEVGAAGTGKLRVALSNQANFGEIRYTADGSAPTAASNKYVGPLEFPEQGTTTIRAATFAGGLELAAPRSKALNVSTLLSRDGSELATCSNEPPTRLQGNQTAQGSPPVYKLNLGDMCWRWHHVPAADFAQVDLRIGRLVWRFSDDAKGAVIRPKSSAAGEFEIHADSCKGPLLASLPLASATSAGGQSELHAKLSSSKLSESRDVCIFATGDPREGQWVLAQMAFSK